MSIETKNFIIECDKEYDYGYHFAYVLVKYIIENYSYDEAREWVNNELNKNNSRENRNEYNR